MSTESIKRGLAAAAKTLTSTSREYRVNNTPWKCPHCGGSTFEHRRILLNSTGASLVGLSWANAEASALICDQCSLITWFLNAPERII